MNKNHLIIDKIGEPISFKGSNYRHETGENFYKYGRHALFIGSTNEIQSYKFFIIKGINYELKKIIELFNIHNLFYKAGWSVRAFGICFCTYNNMVHYGLELENAYYSSGGREDFDKHAFQEFCNQQTGLFKREYFLEKTLGKDWYLKEPERKFFVGDNNIMFTRDKKQVLVDIDPRWGIK